MNREEARKLLGGYAAGILTPEERKALFEAALADQELFDALAREDALAELLEDPAARRELVGALGEEKSSFFDRLKAWMGRPVSWAVAGSVAVALVAVVAVKEVGKRPVAPEPQLIARRSTAAQEAPKEFATAPGGETTRPPAAPAAAREADVGARAKPSAPAGRGIEAPAAAVTAPVLSEERRMAYGGPATVREQEALPAPAAQPAAAAEGKLAPAVVAESLRQDKPADTQATGGVVGGIVGGAPGGVPAPEAQLAKQTVADIAAPAPGLRYTVLRADSSGAYRTAPGTEILRSGDSIRISVETPDSGYLQLLERDESGAWRTVSGRRVERGRQYVLPAAGAIALAGGPGEKQLRVVLGPPPTPARRAVAGLAAEASKTEKAKEAAAPPKAVAESATSGLAVDITLRYR